MVANGCQANCEATIFIFLLCNTLPWNYFHRLF
jgi:hypothetical protein